MPVVLAFFYSMTNVAGTVTFARASDDYFFMLDSAGGPWRVTMQKRVDVSAGDAVEVNGEREPTSKHRIAAKTVEKTGSGGPASAVEAREAPITEIFEKTMPYGNPDWYGRVVVTEGTVIDINRRQTSTQLLIGENNCNFQMELPWPLETPLPKNLMLGARARVRGVLVYTSIEDVEENIAQRIENLEIMPQDASGLEIVELAPFWTIPRICWTFGSILLLAGALLLFLLVRRRWDNMISDARRRERLRLAADLHDGFQQYLAGSMFRLQAAMNLLPEGADASRRQLEGVREVLQHTQNGLRSTLWAMTEESEGPESLMELIRFASSRMAHWQGVVTVVCEGRERTVARKLAASILLIIQEGVANALKHGGAKHVIVTVSFGEGNDGLRLEIKDDGCGFEAKSARKAGHYGLRSMERRSRELGGEMTVESSPEGTTLAFRLP